MNFVDALVIVLLLGAAWSGFRRGLISSSMSLVGAVGGAVVAIRLAPLLMARVDDTTAKVAIGIAGVVLGIGIGEVAGAGVGRALSGRITWRPARALDHGLGRAFERDQRHRHAGGRAGPGRPGGVEVGRRLHAGRERRRGEEREAGTAAGRGGALHEAKS